MPLYEYRCQACLHQFEVIQKFSDPLVDVCPSCGGRVEKLPSSPAIQFKGSGFYITDYARKGSTDAGKAERKPSSSDDKAASSSTESTSSSDSKGESKPSSESPTSGTASKTPSKESKE